MCPVQPDSIQRERSARPHRAVPDAVVAAVAPDEHDDVLRVAWVRAATSHSRLVVCAVVERDGEVASARETIEQRVAELIPDASNVEIDVRVGDRAEQLLACAQRHHGVLLVMGPASHREGVLARFFSPSLPTALLRAAELPILVTRYSPPTGRIVAAVELGEPMKPVLLAAAEEVRRAGGKLYVLHCVAPLPAPGTMEIPVVTTPATDLIDAARIELTRGVAAMGLMPAEVKVEVGPAGSTILQVARELSADLVVVGTHGRSGPARLLLGSIAEEVLRASACNVMVVRAGGNA